MFVMKKEQLLLCSNLLIFEILLEQYFMSSERQVLEEKTPWWGEHVYRYELVLPHIKPTDKIIDIACGTGYGSHLLAQYTQEQVIGGDISKETIHFCKSYWKKENLDFQVLDGTNLPFSDDYFDVVVSFETIEHTTQYMKMLQEFKRILKKTGKAFISTPNFVINSPTGKIVNPYHTQEFTYDELNEILGKVFSKFKIFGQQYIRYEKNSSFQKLVEKFFLLRGIRKIPYDLRNKFFEGIYKQPLYPTSKDYGLKEKKEDILKCQTFFCICEK